MAPLTVRRARRRDAAALCHLYWAFHEHYVRALPDRLRPFPDGEDYGTQLSTALARLFASADEAVFVAEIGDAVVGLVEVAVRQDEAHPARLGRSFGHIGALMVQAEARDRGVGTHLLVAAEAWAREHGAAEMRLDVWETAGGPLPFYERRGYHTLSRALVKPL